MRVGDRQGFTEAVSLKDAAFLRWARLSGEFLARRLCAIIAAVARLGWRPALGRRLYEKLKKAKNTLDVKLGNLVVLGVMFGSVRHRVRRKL